MKLRKEEQYSNALTEKRLYKDFNMTNNRCQRHRNIDAIARSTIHQVPSIYYVITFRGEVGYIESQFLLTFCLDISSIFDKCSILLQTQSQLNHIKTEILILVNLLQMPKCLHRIKKQPLTSEKK